ncbi:hypothetical protein tinsulaeT_12900 [Thalassotalea insulae]|uniref:histidine kinase n=2 Tax=Thalassotalea insulae TaxID=2056778 RepID=A0ABQ6GU16_9GAMM|nr:hypothetical protein tinsulaeT_12900 [Thalassotalea insulae]
MIGFAFTFVFLAMIFIANIFLDESKQQIAQHVKHWSRYIAQMSASALNSGQINDVVNQLANFKTIKSIQHVDIYQLQQPENKYSIVATYDHFKRGEQSPNVVGLTAEQRAIYREPQFDQALVRYIRPIQYKEETIGYVFIQMDSQNGLSLTTQLIIALTIIFFILLVVVFIIAFRLENNITLPLKLLGSDLLAMSQSKNYSMRIKTMPYQELDFLARNINSFLNRVERHINQLRAAEQKSLKLNAELEGKVHTRTEALKESNQELLSTLEKLHQYQDQLVESEKMASLGDMVAGVAHEVNTPIGLGVTASTLLSDRLNEISKAFHDKTLKSSQLRKFLAEGEENVGIIYRNLKRAAELISSFKKVAVDQSSDEFRQFNFAELLNEILLTLAPQIKNTPYQIHFDCPEDLMIVSKPGPINQVMINLILNSITHGFDHSPQGTITVKVMKLGEQLNIHYQDDGKGIDPLIKDKVFDPFTTTKRGEGGSGLGLHLVYNLVTQALGGNIRLDSEPGKGATFEINFPVSEQLL